MRRVTTRRPSFDPVQTDTLLSPREGVRWQVVCGDEGHWRCGLYSPAETAAEQIVELEQHSCPELFMLVSGRLVLLLSTGGETREVQLPTGRPILVSAPHGGYCPDGPHTGVAFVVERDEFDTEYRPASDRP